MKVLLTTPPWEFSEIYPASMSRANGIGADRFGTVTGATEPLGMLYIAAILRRNGHQPLILDGFGRRPQQWIAEITQRKPDLLGLTLSAFSWSKVLMLIPQLRKLLPALPIVAGGPYPTAEGRAALLDLMQLDYAVRGEGETALPALCAALEHGRGLSEIPCLSYREGDDVVENPQQYIDDLDSIPFPAREMVDMSLYRPSVGFYNRLPSVSLITTRGCPYRCCFCFTDNRIRYRSVENVITEIEECVKRYGARHVLFWDEDIAIKRDHAAGLCEAMLRRNLRVSWCASMTMGGIEPELIGLMKRAGCWKLLFGLETGVQKNMETLGKNLDLSRVRERLTIVRRAGIETFATFMFGIPGETRCEAEETIRFACRLPLDYALFLNLTPFPGTAMHKEMEKHGVFQGIWSTQAISFVPHTMTKEDMKQLRVMAYRRFYLRPGYILRRALRMRTAEDLRRSFRGLVAALGMRIGGLI